MVYNGIKVKNLFGKLFFESPWGKGKKPNNAQKPRDFEELFKNAKFNNFFNGGGNGGNNSQTPKMPNINIFAILIIALLVFLSTSMFYVVGEGEQALVIRLGKYVKTAYTGLNFKLPTPFETYIKQKVDRVEKEEIGFRSNSQSNSILSFAQNNQASTDFTPSYVNESLMLTGDENIIDINFVVQWKIKDIRDFVFNVEGPKATVKAAAESAMREIIGNTPISSALSDGRLVIEDKTRKLLQEILDYYETGVEVINIQMLKADPPANVIDAFRDVQSARADKEREINMAQAYQNDILPRSRGEASKILQDAEAYKKEVVSNALGETSRFLAIYNQYKHAPDVIRKRLKIEAMENVMTSLNKVIVDSNMKGPLLPYLPVKSNDNK